MSQLNSLQQRVRDGLLLDAYGPLLSNKQYSACEMILLLDLSLAEAADKLGVSRQGVHELLTRAREQMESFELSLKLLEKNRLVEEMSQLLESSKESLPNNFYNEFKSMLKV